MQGLFVGLFGTFVGLISGVLLAKNATAIVNWLQSTFHLQLLQSNVYFVDYLPSQIQMNDIIHVCLLAIILSFIATIYPAWRASRTQPAEALRYE